MKKQETECNTRLKTFLKDMQDTGKYVRDLDIAETLLKVDNGDLYWEYCKIFVPALIKKHNFQTNGGYERLSELCYAHEEAFGLLTLENVYKSALHKAEHEDDHYEHEYQFVRNTKRKRYQKGEWKDVGIERYNELIVKVIEIRKTNERQEWEENIMQEFGTDRSSRDNNTDDGSKKQKTEAVTAVDVLNLIEYI